MQPYTTCIALHRYKSYILNIHSNTNALLRVDTTHRVKLSNTNTQRNALL